MAKTQTSRRDEQHHLGRRTLIKWSVAAGAALGVSRSKICEILERTAGRDVAFAMSENPTTRSVHFNAGNGGLAFTQLFWPFVDVAKAQNPQFSWEGAATDVAGTAQPLVTGIYSPWTKLVAQKQVTGFLMGNNETHTQTPKSTVGLNGNSIFAVAGALQAASPSTIPMISVNGVSAGTAPGAPAATAVGNADGIVDLFNSAASRMGGLLSNTSDASLYKAHYDAFVQLNRASNRPTTKTAYLTAGGAAKFLGQNLSAKLAIQPADLTRYGVSATTRADVLAVAKTLIIANKAFKAGLTNGVLLNYHPQDPHGHFDNKDYLTLSPLQKGVLDGFMDDLTNTADDLSGKTLSDDITMTFTGDTFKNPTNRAGWGDGTPMNSNLMIVYSSGALKSGWFGTVDRTGAATGVDATGKSTAYNGATMAKFGLASVAYSIAKRDDRAIQTFTGGVTVGGVFGNLKDK